MISSQKSSMPLGCICQETGRHLDDSQGSSQPPTPLTCWLSEFPWERAFPPFFSLFPPGLQSSGLSTWIGHQMLSLSSLPPWAVTLLACILVSIVTEFVSNPATITIFLPILCSLVSRAGS